MNANMVHAPEQRATGAQWNQSEVLDTMPAMRAGVLYGVCQGCILRSCLFNLHADTSCKTLGWMKLCWNQDCQEKYQ